jgi:O-antigen ligase
LTFMLGPLAVGVLIVIASVLLLIWSYRKGVFLLGAAFTSYTLLGGVEFGLGLRPYHFMVTGLGAVSAAKLTLGRLATTVFLEYVGVHLVLIAVAMFGWLRAYDEAYGFALVKTYVAGLLLVMVSMAQIDRLEKVVSAMRVLTYISCVAVGLGVIQAVFGSAQSVAYLFKGEAWFAAHGFAPVGYSNSPFLFGHDVVIGLVPAFVLWWSGGAREAGNHWRPSWPVLTWLLVGLLISANRSSWVAFIVGAAYAAVMRSGPTRRGLAVGLVAASLAVASPLGDMVLVEVETLLTVDSFFGDTRVWERVQLALAGIEMWMEAPLLGHGAGAFTAVVQSASIAGRAPDVVVYPHNIFLGLIVDFGVIGMASFVLAIVIVFRRLSRVRRNAGGTSLGATALSIQAVLVSYVIDSSFHNYFIDLHLWVLIGIGLSLIGIHRHARLALPRTAWKGSPSVAQDPESAPYR